MCPIPPPNRYERFTDWVIDTSQETDIDPHQLWKLRQQDTESEFVDWAQTMVAGDGLSERDLIETAIIMNREPSLPDPPVPDHTFDLETDSGGQAAHEPSRADARDTPLSAEVRDSAEQPPNQGAESPPISTNIETDAGAASAASTAADPGVDDTEPRDTQLEEGPRFSDLTDTTKSDAESDPAAAPTDAGADLTKTQTAHSRQSESPPQETFVTEAEYEQFQEKVRQIVQDLIDFLVSYDMLSTDPGDDDADVERRLQQAAEKADDTTEFFRRMETILTDIEEDGQFDLSEFTDPAEASSNKPDPLTVIEELRSSIKELREVEENLDLRSREAETANESTPTRDSAPTIKSSRNDDPVVLSRLNTLTDMVRREIPEYSSEDSTDDTETPNELDRERQTERSVSGIGSEKDRPTEQTERNKPTEQTRSESTTSSIGTTATAAAGATDRGAERSDSEALGLEDIQGLGSIRQALLPIDLGWLFAALAYGGFDMFTTVLVINNGGSELNPVFSILGQSIIAFVIWKTLIIFLLFVVFYPEDPRVPDTQEWVIPVLTGVVGTFLTINNLLVFITGSGFI